LGCLHVELGDARLGPGDLPSPGYTMDLGATFVVDLADSEAAILGRMRSTTRNYIRQGARKGLTVDVVDGADAAAFAEEYHEQLVEVFGRQGLTPTYPVGRVRNLIELVHPSGQLLLLRVRAPDGRSIATGLVVGGNQSAVLWGAAFRRADADLHPNELMHWEAMRHWRSLGVTSYDMGGRGDYKAKYGGALVETARFRRSRYPVLDLGRDAVRSAFRARQIIRGLPRRWANRRTAAVTPSVDR
jgi:hypothetical protein